ncbi:hypothetical protein QOL99_10785 [Deinococcus sp. MIMF12]|uniref:pPIWI-RE three-gene island domain-containing protein n=1 Tax=Deinococcus rhizophilus TaxID=3049544 RepID=A0ABT7JHV4_9DEIO|nr:hypothetical protein [Deinococcus rhizophilus]MDL2344634.1 hypothetical protein [Deinococcus rhizophilus]
MTSSWKGAGEIQWACLLMEQVGEDSLEALPLLLSAYQSVDDMTVLSGQRAALRHLRQLELLPRLLSKESIRAAMMNAQLADTRDEIELSYDLTPANLSFRRRATHEVNLGLQLAELNTPPDAPLHGLMSAPPDQTLVVHPGLADVRLRIPAEEVPPVAPMHQARKSDKPLEFPLADLERTATWMDDADRLAGRPFRDWAGTIGKLKLRVRGDTGFVDGDSLSLAGLNHLIGLPGAGKTTLINVLCVHMARQDQRVAVFTTAIEVARQQLELLTHYLPDDDVALLVGRSHDTHEGHADRIAGVVAAGDPEGSGFGLTVPGMERFARGCSLRAYATGEEEDVWDDWRPDVAPPCEVVMLPRVTRRGQDDEARHLCPLFSRCGRVHNHVQLVGAKVWLGHVLSTTARVPAHLTARRLSYAELLPEVMDLVIIDEADDAQANLDGQSLLRTPFLGRNGLQGANAELGLAYNQQTRRHGPTSTYLKAANQMNDNLREFVEVIRDPRAVEFSGQLLNARTVFYSLIRLHGLRISHDALTPLAQLWDTTVYDVAFRRDSAPTQADHVAGLLGIDSETVRTAQRMMRRAFEAYPTSDEARTEALTELEQAIALLLGFEPDGRSQWMLNLLMLITLLVSDVRLMRALAGGVDQAFKHTYLPDQAGQGLGDYSTASLLGNFAAISFLRGDNDDNQVEMIVQDRVTRLLPERLSRAGLGVLITSATSYLPQSSSFHSTTPPGYLLLPIREGRQGKLSLNFTPQHDQNGQAIRVSGAGEHRSENLRRVVDALARRSSPGNPLGSQLERDLATIAERISPPGRPRKAALVVNSYDQVIEVLDTLRQANPDLHARSVGLARARQSGRSDLVLRAEIEGAARRDNVSLLVFPMQAIGRGVNMVLGGDSPERDLAAIGVMYFLVRPHPVVGDTTLLHSLVNRATEEFDAADLEGASLSEAVERHRQHRARLYHIIKKLLERPQQVSQLPREALLAFTANLVVPVWQTIGRAIRGGADAEVHFVDAAWAPESVEGRLDRPRTSVLAGMVQLLQEGCDASDPHEREVMQALYGSLASALQHTRGLLTDPADLDDGEGGTWGQEDWQPDQEDYFDEY